MSRGRPAANATALLERVVFVAIVVLSCSVSAAWAFRVPFLQEPDESAHFDYAVSIATAGHVLKAKGLEPVTDLHPYTRYLARVSNFYPMRYSSDARVPANYGTREYFRQVDKDAPSVGELDVTRGGRAPYVLAVYPVGFYALEAAVMSLAARLTDGSLVAMFFAARLACVVLLALFLILTERILRELGQIGPWRRLGILGAIGFFPLTSWVFGYIQPDNLAAVLVSLCLYLGLLSKRSIQPYGLWLATGLALALLIATKFHYFAVVAVPVLANLFIRTWSSQLTVPQRLLRWVTVFAPFLAAGFYCRELRAAPVLREVQSVSPLALEWARSPADLPEYVLRNTLHFYQSYFGFGQGFASYWGSISWTLSRIVIGSSTVYLGLYLLALVLTTAFVALMAFRQLRTTVRLFRIARDRSVLTALRLLCSDLLLNSYLLFLMLLCAASSLTNGTAVNQGRYFLPFVLPTVLCATYYGVQSFPRRWARAVSNVTLALLLGYSCAGTFYGFRSLDARFYSPPTQKASYETWVEIDPHDQCEAEVVGETLRAVFPARRPELVRICGWALDSRYGGLARGMLFSVDDGPRMPAYYGAPRFDAVGTVLDDRILASGYRVTVPTADLAPGRHRVDLFVLEHDRAVPYPTDRYVVFDLR